MLDTSNKRKTTLSILQDLSGGVGLLLLVVGYFSREKPFSNLILIATMAFMLVSFLFGALEDIKNGVVITDYGTSASYRSKNPLIYWLLVIFKLFVVAAGFILIFKIYKKCTKMVIT